MLIFISNDDGYDAPGLRCLVDFLKPTGAEIIVAAPDAPRSGQSAAITAGTPLRITRHTDYDGAKIYSISGTPVDCVKLSLHTLLPRDPDLMVCGINHGTNAGNCVLYSGTMGAVMEACTAGIPSIGFSLLHHSWQADFSHCGKWVRRVVDGVLGGGLPEGVCLNVNIPAHCEPKGLKVLRAARGRWTEEYEEYTDPAGKPFYMLTGHFENREPDNPDTDEYWLKREWVSVVPVSIDPTAINDIPQISRLF